MDNRLFVLFRLRICLSVIKKVIIFILVEHYNNEFKPLLTIGQKITRLLVNSHRPRCRLGCSLKYINHKYKSNH